MNDSSMCMWMCVVATWDGTVNKKEEKVEGVVSEWVAMLSLIYSVKIKPRRWQQRWGTHGLSIYLASSTTSVVGYLSLTKYSVTKMDGWIQWKSVIVVEMGEYEPLIVIWWMWEPLAMRYVIVFVSDVTVAENIWVPDKERIPKEHST